MIFESSKIFIFLILEIYFAIYNKFDGLLLIPLHGSGDKYGESVSMNIRSIGTNCAVFFTSYALRKVTIPENDI